MTIETRALSPALGVEILGIDAAKPITSDIFADILDAWWRNNIILLRGQRLNEDELVNFGAQFGRLWLTESGIREHRGEKLLSRVERPEILLITNMQDNGEYVGALPTGEMGFHQDNVFRDTPARGTLLYAVELPSHGGETLFANTIAAYEALPSDIKARLDGLIATHSYNYNAQSRSQNVSGDGEIFGHTAGARHPAVIRHPETRRKALYVNRIMTMALEGLANDESQSLLDLLFDHMERPEFVYEHTWQVGDIILWDNWCTMHARRDFPADQLRLMRRLTIEASERPTA